MKYVETTTQEQKKKIHEKQRNLKKHYLISSLIN